MFVHLQHSFSTPDYLGVRLSVPRDSSGLALSVLGHVAADPAFKEWELEDVSKGRSLGKKGPGETA